MGEEEFYKQWFDWLFLKDFTSVSVERLSLMLPLFSEDLEFLFGGFSDSSVD